MVQSIDRPDVNGVPPKMSAIAALAKESLAGLAPVLNIRATDNLMSAVDVGGSFDPRESWSNGIIENSRYFRLQLVAARGRRYYDPAADAEITLEVISVGLGMKAPRKHTGPAAKVLARLRKWLESHHAAPVVSAS